MVVYSMYLSLFIVLFRDGVTQDIQESDIPHWGRRVPEHLWANRWGRSYGVMKADTYSLTHMQSVTQWRA